MLAGSTDDARATYIAKLEESCLSADDAKRLGMQLMNAAQTKKLSEGFHEVPSMLIPYYDAAGKKSDFFRVRYLEALPGILGKTKKGKQRYAQPAGSEVRAYFAKGFPWADAFKAMQPIHITEGEKKAACGCKHGHAVVGLGGVWSWRSAKRGEGLIPDLDAIEWKDRQVYIVFDSDAATNPDIAKAQASLAEELTARGARPAIVKLPDLPEAKKTGLDDLIAALGAKAYDDALAMADPFTSARELWKLNGEVVYIKDPGVVVAMQDGRMLTPQAFTSHAYSNRHYWEQRMLANGDVKMEKKPLAKAWLEWPQRSELERLSYRPGLPTVTDEREYNYWKGWGCEPARGEVALWRELLDYLFAGDAASRKWFEQWCAWPVQHPGDKMYCCAVVWGVHAGTGKSLVGYSLKQVYGKNFGEISEKELGSAFNEWAQNKQLVMGDDVTSSQSRRTAADQIKNMVTQHECRINVKWLPSYTVPDCINYYFTSNHPDAFFLEDYDRRFFIHEVVGGPKPREFYDRYDAWLNSGALGPALFHHLLHVNLDGFAPHAKAPETAAKVQMKLDSKSDVAMWVVRLKDDPDQALSVGGVVAGGDLFTNEELLMFYDQERQTKVTANGLGRELKRAGFRYANEGVVVKTTRGNKRLYAVRNAERWARAKPHLVAQHYDETRGQQAAEPKKEKYK